MLWNSERRSVTRISRPGHGKNYSASGREIRKQISISIATLSLLHLCHALNYSIFSVSGTRTGRFTVTHSVLVSAE